MFLRTICVVFSFFWIQLSCTGEKVHENPYLKNYEILEYDSGELHNSHQRAKRSVHNQHVELQFKAYDRNFHLRLRRDVTTFSSDFKIEMHDGSLQDHDISYIYNGELADEAGSFVHGSIIDGVFTGQIHTDKGKYYVQRSEQVLNNPQKYHSIIYHDDHVDLNPPHIQRMKRSEAASSPCGLANNEILERMQEVSMSAVDGQSRKKRSVEAPLHEFHSSSRSDHNIYTYDREKRETRKERTCTMFLQSDTMLWDYFTEKLGYGVSRTTEEITSLFSDHLKGIKAIYEDTIFKKKDGTKEFKAISFVVRRIKINQTKISCPGGSMTPIKDNPYCQPNIDVSNFLNLNSLTEHDDFCLAYVFTYRDFTGGTLGLAWVGSPQTASGGICERYKQYNENGKKIYKSLNTGIVTTVNYNQKVPTKVSTLTFAHEVGHNFGSPHDDGKECTPYTEPNPDKNGNYIMFASATSGDRKHNSMFSTCSKGNISDVLDAVLNELNGKHNCFVASEAAFCGNMIKEAGEQCDCGYEDDCVDKCCNPRDHKKECQLKSEPNVMCSPSQGPCCTDECQMKPKSANYSCKSNSDCTLESFCNGTAPTCPDPVPRKDNLPCNDGTQVCKKGDCTGSVCHIIDWEQCFLHLPADRAKQNRSKLCYVSCQKGSNGTCISTSDENLQSHPDMMRLLNTVNDGKPIQLPAGAPCDNFQGYCDVFHKCRGVDADGPLARLKNLLFNIKTINNIKDWITEHWWAVLLMGLGLIIFMGIFIKVCAVHTPSSNPKKPPARKISMARPRVSAGPPPPYPGPNRGGPAHGKGRGREDRGRGGARSQAYEMKSPRV